MTSEAQIAANRRNAQKSTGHTHRGRAFSSRNALKTGTYAKARIIKGEDSSSWC